MLENEQREEAIKDSLHALDLEYHGNHSQDLLLTFQKSHFLPPKSRSFMEVSDWSDRYPSGNSSSGQLPPPKKKIKRIQEQYHHFAASLSKTKLHRAEQDVSFAKKQKIELAPINVRFANCKSKSRLKRKDQGWTQREGHLSFYEANYQPLSLLYKLKTKEKDQKRGQMEELPLILPQSPRGEESRLPRTERVSSILRRMKQHQQLRRRQCENGDMFRIQS